MHALDFKIDNLSLRKKDKVILHELSCHVPANALTILIGANGAGKSSLLRCLAGLETTDSGDIFLSGKSLEHYSQSERTRRIGWCPAETRLTFSYSCLELVCMGRFATHAGYPKQRDYEIAKEAMAMLGLEHMHDLASSVLSSGAFRKLMIARVLASQNSVLLFDEPDAHLDIACVFKVLDLLKSLTRLAKTICVSLHNLQLASQYADHLIVLKAGEKIGEGSSHEIFEPELMNKAFGVGMTTVQTPRAERVLFHPLSQNLSEGSINDKGTRYPVIPNGLRDDKHTGPF